jgi:hypothetical protein
MKEFDVREAGCYAADRDLLLGAIESGYSTLDHFNEEMRKVLAAALHTAHSRSWEGSSSTPSLSLKASKAAKLRWQGVMQMAWRDLEMTEQNGKTSQGDAANSVPTFATVTAQASSRSLPLVPDDASATDDESATDDFTAPDSEIRDATLPDGEQDAAVA